MFKKVAVLIVVALTLLGLFIWVKNNSTTKPNNPPAELATDVSSQNDPPQIISTKPNPLEDTIISSTDIVEITFNRPLENEGQFKSRIEPKIDYKVELADGRKTARIKPTKPYPLGSTFTLFIDPDSKFDGVGEWRQSKIYHFRTVQYRGV